MSIAWVVNGDMYTLDHEDIGNGNRITVISHTDAAVISQLDVRMNNSDISVACGGGQATLRLAGECVYTTDIIEQSFILTCSLTDCVDVDIYPMLVCRVL